MKIILRIAVMIVVIFSSHTYAMMTPLTDQQVVKDPVVGIMDLSQKLQKIDLRSYSNISVFSDQSTHKDWHEVIQQIEYMINQGSTYKDLKSLFNNMKDLSNELFNAVTTGNNDFREKKTAIERLSKKQSEVKRFLLGQKAKSFFSFGKKQDEYKNMRQLLLGMIDMLNAKIDLMKKSVK